MTINVNDYTGILTLGEEVSERLMAVSEWHEILSECYLFVSE